MSSTFKISGLGQAQGGQGWLQESHRWEARPPRPQGPRGWAATASSARPFSLRPEAAGDQARGERAGAPSCLHGLGGACG